MITRLFSSAWWLGLLIVFALAFPPHSGLAESPPAIITLDSLDGEKITPLKSDKEKPMVVIFITTDCPIANALAPEINRLYKHYQTQGIQFTLVHVDPGLSASDAKKHATEYSLQPSIVIDRKHLLVKQSKANVTPQTAVFNSKGNLVYTGRINNQWTDYGKRRAQATEHNLRETLDALLARKKIPKAQTTAVGCYIPELD